MKLQIITALTLLCALPFTSPATGIPVIDVTSIGQEIKNGLTQIQSLEKQLQEYELQIEQYKNQVLNTSGIASAMQIWQDSQKTINQVLSLTGVLQSSTGLQSQLSRFENVNDWLNSANLYTNQTAGSAAQKSANDALINSIVKQQSQITTDAATLLRLENQAGTVQGQKQTLDATNELAALQQQQLLQIRSLLVSEQQALAARNSTLANSEAQKQAATQRFFQATITTESAGGFRP